VAPHGRFGIDFMTLIAREDNGEQVDWATALKEFVRKKMQDGTFLPVSTRNKRMRL
jgi:hypothetical protein